MSFIISEAATVIFILLIIYVLSASFIEHYSIPFGHETGIVVMIGIIISFVTQYEGHEEFNDIMEFNQNLFFYLVLPPIVFASAYNMKRKKFFQNIKYILLFGVVGTIIAFILFSLMSIAAVTYIPI